MLCDRIIINLTKLPAPWHLRYLTGINFRGDRNDRISRVYIFEDSPSKCRKNSQNCLKMTEFSKIAFFAGTTFRELSQKPRNPRQLIPIMYMAEFSLVCKITRTSAEESGFCF